MGVLKGVTHTRSTDTFRQVASHTAVATGEQEKDHNGENKQAREEEEAEGRKEQSRERIKERERGRRAERRGRQEEEEEEEEEGGRRKRQAAGHRQGVGALREEPALVSCGAFEQPNVLGARADGQIGD